MASAKEPPHDEVQWRSPPIAQSMGGIHTNSVLHYFSHSPFFDATSNNATLTTQATYNASMFHLIQTREAFESRLKTMQGLEFMVAHEPTGPAQAGLDSGIWVIRKQVRRKVQGAADNVTVLSSYFVVGENIYMSPSIAKVLGSRLLSTAHSLTTYLSTASILPLFSPALGNIFIRPNPKAPLSAQSSQAKQASKESTPMSEHMRSGLASSTSQFEPMGESLREARSLADSFFMCKQYGMEYVDENPLVGEPGSFILSSARGPPQAATLSQSKLSGMANATSTERSTPQPVDGPFNSASKRVHKGLEKSVADSEPSKRRKSKANSVSPVDVAAGQAIHI